VAASSSMRSPLTSTVTWASPTGNRSRTGCSHCRPGSPSSPRRCTLGAFSFARSGRGQAGGERSTVRPMARGKAVPGVYSRRTMLSPPVQWVGGARPCHAGACVRPVPRSPRCHESPVKTKA
jgi:hypothetical protein